MKQLIECLMESRGIVTGKDDWTELCEYIGSLDPNESYFQKDDINKYPVKKLIIKNHLPNWINQVSLCIPLGREATFSLLGGGMACVLYDEIVVKNSKADNVIICYDEKYINKTGKFETQILQHELQHAHDFYISNHKVVNNKFKVRVYGIDDSDDTWYDIVNNKKISPDAVFDLFSEFTEFGHNVEISAYLREFNLFLNHWDKSSIDYEDIINKNNVDRDGSAPLMLYKAFQHLQKKYKSLSEEDIDYIIDNCNAMEYFKKVKGSTFNVKGYSGFQKILDWFFNIGLKPIVRRYTRVADDHRIKLTNIFK